MYEALDPPIRRAKFRIPRLGNGHVPRPRLTARVEQARHVPLTLVSAPAGFGKTTLLAEWASGHARPLAWLTVDHRDRDLHHFALHVVAAITEIAPGRGVPPRDLFQHSPPRDPTALGAMLADELLDGDDECFLVVDDYQIAASVHSDRFLAGLLRANDPGFHLLLATRSDPALPLARMRLHGQIVELRAADLRFSDEETQALLGVVEQGEGGSSPVVALLQQTGGWIAGMRLAALARPAAADLARPLAVASDRHLMDYLVEEVVAAQPAEMQDFLLRTAVVDRICASLADALLDAEPVAHGRIMLERLAHDSLFLEPDDEQEGWYRYYPLFRGLLRHQLDARCSAEQLATLHTRASAWYVTQGSLDLAIQHCLAAGDVAGAASLVEDHIHVALNQEDWPALAGWLKLLPQGVISASPALLLAKGWVSHFSGRSIPITVMLAELNALLTVIDAEPEAIAAWEAERDALCIAALLVREREPEAAVAFARGIVARIAPRHRLATGLACYGLGCALQAAGRTEDAIRFLTEAVERSEDRIDAGSIRALGGLMFVQRQAGNIRACDEVAGHILMLAQRHHLPVAAGWAHWMLGWLAYERDELDVASEHFTAVVADHHRVHLHTTCEAMFGLTLTYRAQAQPIEAANTLRRLWELIFDANALEYLPLLRGFEARLALLNGDRQSARDWLASSDGVTTESGSLDCFDHPFLNRIKVLLADGSTASLERAQHDLQRLEHYTEARHHAAHRIEMLALSALALDAQGQREAALDALRRSIELAAGARVIRPYIDLGPSLVPLLHQLAQRLPEMAFMHQVLDALDGRRVAGERQPAAAKASAAPVPMLELLTVREAEVLACLNRRLSYQEIGAELFISPQTVKSHAANIYAKLGVGSRRQALAKAETYGWFVSTQPLGAGASSA